MVHGRLFVQGVIDMEYRAAGIAEKVLDTLIFQCPDEYLCPAKFFHRSRQTCVLNIPD
jgi:hypothetical protein